MHMLRLRLLGQWYYTKMFHFVLHWACNMLQQESLQNAFVHAFMWNAATLRVKCFFILNAPTFSGFVSPFSCFVYIDFSVLMQEY